LHQVKPASVLASLPVIAMLLGAPSLLTACGAQVDRHGHVFIDIDLNEIQPGWSKEQVQTVLGSPDTTSAIGGDAYYYISSTTKTVAFLKPREIDRQVVAVYFDRNDTVRDVAHYGMKDGIVVDYYKGETPARGKDLTFVEQIFGNLSNRKMFKDQRPSGGANPSGIPGI
jgi:outer membrane protein assembly factor BamE (lipoprotein component of BamABCDE complex)